MAQVILTFPHPFHQCFVHFPKEDTFVFAFYFPENVHIQPFGNSTQTVVVCAMEKNLVFQILSVPVFAAVTLRFVKRLIKPKLRIREKRQVYGVIPQVCEPSSSLFCERYH